MIRLGQFYRRTDGLFSAFESKRFNRHQSANFRIVDYLSKADDTLRTSVPVVDSILRFKSQHAHFIAPDIVHETLAHLFKTSTPNQMRKFFYRDAYKHLLATAKPRRRLNKAEWQHLLAMKFSSAEDLDHALTPAAKYALLPYIPLDAILKPYIAHTLQGVEYQTVRDAALKESGALAAPASDDRNLHNPGKKEDPAPTVANMLPSSHEHQEP